MLEAEAPVQSSYIVRSLLLASLEQYSVGGGGGGERGRGGGGWRDDGREGERMEGEMEEGRKEGERDGGRKRYMGGDDRQEGRDRG